MKKKISMIGLCFLMTIGFSNGVMAENQQTGNAKVSPNDSAGKLAQDPPRGRRGRRVIRRPWRPWRPAPRPWRPWRPVPRPISSYMTCRAGLRTYQGYISRVWYGRAWGFRNRITHQRACQAALRACLSYSNYYYNSGRCVILGKKSLEDVKSVPTEFIEAN